MISFGIFAYLSVIPFILGNMIIFPFYSYVTKKNLEREKELAVFPILYHFYKACRLSVILALVLWTTLLANTVGVVPYYVAIFGFSVNVIVLNAFTQIHHILLILLAIQRFVLYFSHYNIWSPSKISKAIILLYILICSKDFVLLVCYSIRTNGSFQSGMSIEQFVSLYFQVSLIILACLTSLVYIPMMCSVQKLSELTTNRQSHPEKYIFYQAGIYFSFKWILLLLVLLKIHSQDSLVDIHYFILLSDMSSTPSLIQLSYLMCNERNVKLLWSLSFWQIVKVLCCGKAEPRRVEPTSAVEDQSTL